MTQTNSKIPLDHWLRKLPGLVAARREANEQDRIKNLEKHERYLIGRRSECQQVLDAYIASVTQDLADENSNLSQRIKYAVDEDKNYVDVPVTWLPKSSLGSCFFTFHDEVTKTLNEKHNKYGLRFENYSHNKDMATRDQLFCKW
jgi:hypothetical protein